MGPATARPSKAEAERRPRRRAAAPLVLLAMFSSLRWSELGGLRRCDIDLAGRTVRVTRQLIEVRGGGFAFGPAQVQAGMMSV